MSTDPNLPATVPKPRKKKATPPSAPPKLPNQNLVTAIGRVLAETEKRWGDRLDALAATIGDHVDKHLNGRLAQVAAASNALADASGRSALDRADTLLEELSAFRHSPAEMVATPNSTSPLVRSEAKSPLHDLGKFIDREDREFWEGLP